MRSSHPTNLKNPPKHQAVEIRELIIRCVSQMVLARVGNIKSGWKSVFMVFTTAAGDAEPTLVRLAFDTIEKIVREQDRKSVV